MIGFTFRNIHSSTFGIGVRSVDRSLIPELRRNEFTIPGRHGTIDFGLNTYEKRPIQVSIGLLKNADWEALRANAREVARWLSGKGYLVFDDEPDKAYDAVVYGYVGIEQLELLPTGLLTVTFECQPFAESLEYRQVNIPSITEKPYNIVANVAGTAETCCIITVKNIGDSNIEGITITRKVAI